MKKTRRNDNIEVRVLPQPQAEVRAEGEDGDQAIAGSAVIYDTLSQDLGGFRERFMPGAFGDLDGEDIIATFDHDTRLLLGRTPDTLSLDDSEEALRYRITPPATSTGQDVMELIRRKDVRGSSFTFRVLEGGEEWEEPKDEGAPAIRTVTKARLFEVAPVVRPAYEVTDVGLAKRSLEDYLEEQSRSAETEEEREQALAALRLLAARQRYAEASLGP